MRSGLRSSKNQDIRQLWLETSSDNVTVDSLLVKTDSLASAKKVLKLQIQNASLNHIHLLELQGISVTAIQEIVSKSKINAWSKSIQLLPAVLFCFVRKGLIQQLPTMSNLCGWGKVTSPACPLCGQIQTNKHVLSNCSASATLERYKARHDAILYIL